MPDEIDDQGSTETSVEEDPVGTVESQETPGEGQGSDEYSLSTGYLEGLDETHKALLEPHVKEWDKQVTQKFQEYAEKLKPYQELGDIDQLRQAQGLARRIQEDPNAVISALAQSIGLDLSGYQQYQASLQQQNGQSQPQPQNSQNAPNPYADFPEPLVSQFTRYDETLSKIEETLAKVLEDREKTQQTQQQAKEQYELDQLLKGLEEKHGEFDQQYVLLQMYQGVDPDQAVANFKALISNHAQQLVAPQQSAPKVMSAGGAPAPPPNFDPGKASQDEVTKMVASVLSTQQGS